MIINKKIVFDQLYIDSNDSITNGRLYLSSHFSNLSMGGSYAFHKIVIDNQNTFNEIGPSDNPIFEVFLVPDGPTLTYNVEIPDNKDLYFVWLIVKNLDTGLEEYYNVTGVFYLKYAYQNVINLLKDFNENCVIPQELTDYSFKITALDLALKTGNNLLASQYWAKYFQNYQVVNLLNNA